MTRKEIDTISLSEAMKIYLASGFKMSFNTKDEEIKAKARKILRDEKKQTA